MSKHPADHTLADYNAGRLPRHAALAVQRHLARCPRCQRRQAQWQRIGADVEAVLRSATPDASRMDRWWLRIRERSTRPVRPVRPSPVTMLAPMLLTLALLLMPLMAGWGIHGEWQQVSHTTAASPMLDTTIIPAETGTGAGGLINRDALRATPASSRPTPAVLPASTPLPTP